MRLNYMELRNFKQYYGKQKLEFAGFNNNSNKNVTVVYGNNGRGKTTLYRALIFALYGDRFLEQDKDYNDRNKNEIIPDLYIINTKALQEDYNKEKNGVNAYVEVEFENNKKIYKIKRTMRGIQKDNNKIIEEESNVKLSLTKLDGNTEIYNNRDKVDQIINDILDSSLKNYFLFDGEKIERLTRPTKQHREEVARGIKGLLKIDELNCAIDALKLLSKKLRKKLSKISVGEYKKLISEIDDKYDKIEELKKENKQKKDEMRRAESELAHIKKELEKFKKHEETIKKREDLISDRDDLIAKKKAQIKKINNFDNKAIYLLAEEIISQAKNKIDKYGGTGIDYQTKKIIVKNILENNENCICGRDVKIDSKEHKHLEDWLNNEEENIFNNKLKLFNEELVKTLQFITDHENRIESILQNFSIIDEDIEEINTKIEKINKKIEHIPDRTFSKKEKYRKDINEKIGVLRKEIDENRKIIEKLREKIDEKEKEKEEKEKKLGIKNIYSQRLELSKNTYNELKNIKQSFIAEIKNEIEEKSFDLFNKFIESDDSQSFKKIVVNEDYSLQILSWNDQEFLSNISKGQRQILSLSFITGLATIASRNEAVEFPLFMDTPFGRLSGEHRDNLLKYIPELTPQWILLATDTEFTNIEAQNLKATNRWGRLYELKNIANGHSKLKELDINSFQPSR